MSEQLQPHLLNHLPARNSARKLPATPTPHNSAASFDHDTSTPTSHPPPPLPQRPSHISVSDVPPPLPPRPLNASLTTLSTEAVPPYPQRHAPVLEPSIITTDAANSHDIPPTEPDMLSQASLQPQNPTPPPGPPPRPRTSAPLGISGSFSSAPDTAQPLQTDHALHELRTDKLSHLLGNEAETGDGFLSEAEFNTRYSYAIPVLDFNVHREKRDKIAYELLTTETTYVRNMQITLQLWRTELMKAARESTIPFSEARVEALFSNMSFLLNVNTVLWQALKERFVSWSSQQKLGDVLKTLAPYLKMYTQYTASYDGAAGALSDMLEHSTRFTALHQQLSRHPLSQRMGLSGFLIQPVQRLPRYVLLLSDLLKNTLEIHSDYVDLQGALASMRDVASKINEEIARAENKAKCLAIQSRFPTEVVVVAPHRKYIIEGTLVKQCRKDRKPREFFLFNDILIYAQSLPTGGLLHSATIDLHQADVTEPRDPALIAEHAMQVLAPGKSFIVFGSSAPEKTKWLAMLRGAIDALRAEAVSTGQGKPAFASLWDSDNTADACTLCNDKFTFIKRRHHCRSCGKLVCGACSDKKIIVKAVDPRNPVRVCKTCFDASKAKQGFGSSSGFGLVPRSLSTSHLSASTEATPQTSIEAQPSSNGENKTEGSDSAEDS